MSEYSDKKIGVVLSGCGVFDGSEIHEATLTLLSLDKAKARTICLAPDIRQAHVIDHRDGRIVDGSTRQVMSESARISRGNIRDLKSISSGDVDALIFPGGYGAAKNLSSYAFDGPDMKVDEDVRRLVEAMHAAKKPMGFICIAPVIAAKVLGKHRPILTIGNDPETAATIEKLGGKHVVCKVDDIAVDFENKIVSTPAYMLGPSISFIALGIEKCIGKVLEMT